METRCLPVCLSIRRRFHVHLPVPLSTFEKFKEVRFEDGS